MNHTHLDFLQDRAVKRYCIFLLSLSSLLIMACIVLCVFLTNSAKTVLLSHDGAIISSLTEQGVSEHVIQKFAVKTGLALRRMEQLIQSMLKITRLDAGNVVFEKELCPLTKLVSDAVRELTTRAASEHKTIILEGSDTDALLCDAAWTGEAVGNIVKNALDHMGDNGIVRITWEVSPFTGMISITDNGSGIAPKISITFSSVSIGAASHQTHRALVWDCLLQDRSSKVRAALSPCRAHFKWGQRLR